MPGGVAMCSTWNVGLDRRADPAAGGASAGLRPSAHGQCPRGRLSCLDGRREHRTQPEARSPGRGFRPRAVRSQAFHVERALGTIMLPPWTALGLQDDLWPWAARPAGRAERTPSPRPERGGDARASGRAVFHVERVWTGPIGILTCCGGPVSHAPIAESRRPVDGGATTTAGRVPRGTSQPTSTQDAERS